MLPATVVHFVVKSAEKLNVTSACHYLHPAALLQPHAVNWKQKGAQVALLVLVTQMRRRFIEYSEMTRHLGELSRSQ